MANGGEVKSEKWWVDVAIWKCDDVRMKNDELWVKSDELRVECLIWSQKPEAFDLIIWWCADLKSGKWKPEARSWMLEVWFDDVKMKNEKWKIGNSKFDA